jgi:3-hydroxyisobutyrate dehydrogenase-like beta-hydroxyacid dehydrogenase
MAKIGFLGLGRMGAGMAAFESVAAARSRHEKGPER